MYLRYDQAEVSANQQHGGQVEERDLQHQQRKRKRTPLNEDQGSSPSRVLPRQTPAIKTPMNNNEPVTYPPVTVADASTTYTNPGFVVYQQWTTVTEGGSVTVKSQITISNVVETASPFSGEPESAADGIDKGVVTGALLTANINRPTASTISRIPTTFRTSAPASSATESSSAAQSNESNPFNPIVIFVLCLVLVLGGAFLITSIFLYRRSKKRKQQEEEANRKSMGKEKAILLRPGSAGSQRAESPLPPPPPLSPLPERDPSILTRKHSELLPSPMVAFPGNAYSKFKAPSTLGRSTQYPASSVYDRDEMESDYEAHALARPLTTDSERARKASDVFGLHFSQNYSLSGSGSLLQVVESSDGGQTPRPSLEAMRGRLPSTPSSSARSARSQPSRHKSVVSMESAIDPDLAYTSNGFRISTQFDDASSLTTPTTHTDSPSLPRKPPFGAWAEYDLTRPSTGYSSKRSEYDGQSVMSPRLSPLGENSIWEDALVDVELDRPKTGASGDKKLPMI